MLAPIPLSLYDEHWTHLNISSLSIFPYSIFRMKLPRKKERKPKKVRIEVHIWFIVKILRWRRRKKTVVPFFPFNHFLLCSRLLFIFNYYFYFFLKSKLKEFLTSLEYPNIIVMHVAFGAGLHVIFLFFKVFNLSEFVLQLFV